MGTTILCPNDLIKIYDALEVCYDNITLSDKCTRSDGQFGRVKNPKTKQCVYPASPPPTRRPNPTLEVNDRNLMYTFILILMVVEVI